MVSLHTQHYQISLTGYNQAMKSWVPRLHCLLFAGYTNLLCDCGLGMYNTIRLNTVCEGVPLVCVSYFLSV